MAAVQNPNDLVYGGKYVLMRNGQSLHPGQPYATFQKYESPFNQTYFYMRNASSPFSGSTKSVKFQWHKNIYRGKMEPAVSVVPYVEKAAAGAAGGGEEPAAAAPKSAGSSLSSDPGSAGGRRRRRRATKKRRTARRKTHRRR